MITTVHAEKFPIPFHPQTYPGFMDAVYAATRQMMLFFTDYATEQTKALDDGTTLQITLTARTGDKLVITADPESEHVEQKADPVVRKLTTESRTFQAIREARDYFYPQGGWCGYNQFFESSLPSRIGSVLCNKISCALYPRQFKVTDITPHAQCAIDILRSTHVKHSAEGRVLCYPTSEAAKAAQLLSRII